MSPAWWVFNYCQRCVAFVCQRFSGLSIKSKDLLLQTAVTNWKVDGFGNKDLDLQNLSKELENFSSWTYD